ncbi:MAG: DNA repair protein RecO [Candidatus Izimaplasma sp.]|nr:DNA repair protein RecO [Candidatus Izimaplasma bacterium]
MAETEGFVLQSIDYKEDHKILYLYTEQGHQTVIAYRVKKMNNIQRFLSQRGSLIRFKRPQKELDALQDGTLINAYETIKQDPIAYTRLLHILELVRHVIDDHSNHHKMFHFLTKLFDQMNQSSDTEIYQFIFELKLLHFIGYGLNFKQCNICQSTNNLVFHPSSGGVICPKHIKDLSDTYRYDIYEVLAHYYYIDISQDTPRQIPNTKRLKIAHIIDMLYDEFVGYKTKSSQILKQMKKI